MTSGGQPLAYSNSNTGEVFPIVVPSGVTVIGVGTPVYLWPDAGLIPASVLDLSGDATLAKLRIGGGNIGIDMNDIGSSTVSLTKITFNRNRTALACVQTSGGTTTVTLDNCRITDADTAGTMQPQAIGLRFEAREEEHGISVIEATVNNLTTSGDFSTLSGGGYFNDSPLMAENNGNASQLIQAFASGFTSEHANGLGSSQPIAEVRLAINGGILDAGGDTEGDGWDIAVHSAQKSSASFKDDFAAGTTVTVTGTTMDGFNLAGVHASGSIGTRGLMQLRGQTHVTKTGHLFQPVATKDIRNGVHIYSLEGYQGFTAADSTIAQSTGNGVFLHTAGTATNVHEGLEVGFFLGLLRAKIHNNSGCGIEMQAGTPNPATGFSQQSIVGGTWSMGTYDIQLQSGNALAARPFGQGVVADTAISNNGEQGVRVEMDGRHQDIAFCRFTNCFIWNQPQEGFFGYFHEGGGGQMVTPLIHCTVAGNGDAVGRNIECETGQNATAHYVFWDYNLPGSPVTFATEIANSIFQRKTPTDVDFGPILHSACSPSSPTGIQQIDVVALGGIRAVLAVGYGLLRIQDLDSSINDTTQFVGISGSVQWGVPKASQLFLSPLNPTPFFTSPYWLNTQAPESWEDFSGDSRPGNRADWDKGGEEL